MGLFIFAIILLVFALAAWFVRRYFQRAAIAPLPETPRDRYGDEWASYRRAQNIQTGASVGSKVALGAMITFLVGGLLAGFFSSFTTVSTKNVGILTTFGHPDGELSNGAHFIAPWSKVTEMAANVQTDQYLGNSDNDTSNSQQPCMDVRIANQSIACVEVTIRWRIVPGSAPELFRDYKTFDHVRDSLVTLNLKSALNNAFADYNPLQILQSGAVPQDILNGLGKKVQTTLVGADGKSGQIGGQIEVLQVILPLVHFDQTTQVNINAFQAAVANTRIATQNVETAKKQAEANDVLKKSLENAGNGVLISKCLDLVAQGKNVPGTCLPLTSGTGSVLVQSPTGK
jgi:regulator of protease activity HflC (stomatin/prohibitin superfamily)